MTHANPIDPLALLKLGTVPRLGSQRIRNLMARFKSPQRVFHASLRELVQVDGVDKTLAEKIRAGGDAAFVESQTRLLEAHQAQLISYWDAAYPAPLKKTVDAPILLYVRGDVNLLKGPAIAVVGTRAPSTYGKLVTDTLARELVANGITIVSGFARGVDTIAHSAAFKAGGTTVAVLGSGVDVIYPYENQKLAADLVQQKKGALLSEFPMGSKPDAPHFPRRNRIISGMTPATLIIEAGLKSGALITADFALEQGRDVLAVPGNINSPKSVGCNYLIQQGAKLVSKIDDILEELHLPSKQHDSPSADERLKQLSGVEARVYSVLNSDPQHIDKISAACQLSISETLGVLLSLELRNYVNQYAGKHFVKT